MENKTINVTKSSLPSFKDFTESLKQLWSTHQLTNNGGIHKCLEQRLVSYLNVENLTLLTNGHLALENALFVLPKIGEIISTPFTFASTTHAIVRSGLTPTHLDPI